MNNTNNKVQADREYEQHGDNKDDHQDNKKDYKRKIDSADEDQAVNEKNGKPYVNDKNKKEDKNMQHKENEGDVPKELADGTKADSNLAAVVLTPDNQALLDALRTMFEDRLGVG